MQAINAMSPAEQREPAWLYWKSRALQALAASSQDGAAMAAEARELLAAVASPLHFYGKLAAEELGRPLAFPPRPLPPTAEERAAVAALPGLQRALLLVEIGLRSEGVREWNFTLVGMNERELLAAAALACERQVWDRCINTSERTREQVDMSQRFPTPFRADVLARSREAGLDPAYVYGLIRQESRFITNARSVVGAAGLMQLMPATARWTARKLGVDAPAATRIDDPTTNLKLGTGYLKLMLDSFDGSHAMAAAGYNAGPGRPRRWREGPALDPVVWIENIPFSETRDYVKKVMSNTADYAALMSGEPASLRARLGKAIGPATAPLTPAEKELP
jgi:soluble lytic murein transglycosylase